MAAGGYATHSQVNSTGSGKPVDSGYARKSPTVYAFSLKKGRPSNGRPKTFWSTLEAAGGLEPPYNGFADRRLTTWLSRLFFQRYCTDMPAPCQERKLLVWQANRSYTKEKMTRMSCSKNDRRRRSVTGMSLISHALRKEAP